MSDIFDKKPFSINDLACDEKGDSVKTNMDIWLEDVKAEYKEMQKRLEAFTTHLGNFPIYIETDNHKTYGYHSVNNWIRNGWKILEVQGSSQEATVNGNSE